VWSKIIVFGHNLAIYFGVLLYFEIWPGHAALYALPGLVILVVNGLFVATYLGVISARFRDVPQITASLVQIAFFVTPIMWKPEFLGNQHLVATLNPFFHLIEIVRAPLLGKIPAPDHYVAVALITAANLLLAGFFFVRYRARISFWV
jgi:ABC-2 type transport system permease protein/lipopolysaccharide transport system permease protein